MQLLAPKVVVLCRKLNNWQFGVTETPRVVFVQFIIFHKSFVYEDRISKLYNKRHIFAYRFS
jgi:hypothetical protein